MHMSDEDSSLPSPYTATAQDGTRIFSNIGTQYIADENDGSLRVSMSRQVISPEVTANLNRLIETHPEFINFGDAPPQYLVVADPDGSPKKILSGVVQREAMGEKVVFSRVLDISPAEPHMPAYVLSHPVEIETSLNNGASRVILGARDVEHVQEALKPPVHPYGQLLAQYDSGQRQPAGYESDGQFRPPSLPSPGVKNNEPSLS